MENRPKPRGRESTRILIDRNIWSHLADLDAGPELLRASLAGKATILVAPTIVFETLQLPNRDALLKNMALLTMPNWHRLMPDAYSESMEIVGEIQRLRPDWLTDTPRLNGMRAIRHDWVRKKGGFWWRAQTDPVELAEALGIQDGWHSDLTSKARLESRERREQLLEARDAEKWRLDDVWVSPQRQIPGWNGQPVAAWRMAGMMTVSAGLQIRGHPYADWIGAQIDPSQAGLNNPSWVAFWLHEASEKLMPRLWLRWAFEWFQGFQKVTKGSPGDVALATYLPECSVFVSNDRNIIRNTNGASKYAPVPVGKGHWLPAGREGVDGFLDLVRTSKL